MWKRLAFVLLLVATIGSCGGGPETMTAADDDLGARFDLASGDFLEVRLESNATTGYSWQLASAPDAIRLDSDEFEAPSGDLVGQAGVQVLTFEATSEGAGILRLEYIRPFDDPPVPDRVAEFIVVVDDAEWPPVTPDPPGTATDSVEGPVTVPELVQLEAGPVSVTAFVVWDETSARLCELLMESYPAQCGGAAVEISDPENLTVDFDEAEGVRWTPGPVDLVGSWDGNRFTSG